MGRPALDGTRAMAARKRAAARQPVDSHAAIHRHVRRHGAIPVLVLTIVPAHAGGRVGPHRRHRLVRKSPRADAAGSLAGESPGQGATIMKFFAILREIIGWALLGIGLAAFGLAGIMVLRER